MNPTTAVGGMVVFLGLASFGVLAWAWRRVILLDRAVDAGDVVVLGVFAIFGAFCVCVGWLLFRYPVALLFSGLALLAVSHVLTPCEERLAKLRRARASLRQL